MRTAKPPRSKLPERCFAIQEKHVQQAVVEFLQHDGWRAIRTEHAIERTAKGDFQRRVGEVGMPDYLFLRYRSRMDPAPSVRALSEALWIEFKRPGEKPRNEQRIWQEVEASRGALVMVVDEYDTFAKWYQGSGLYRSHL